MVGRYVRSTVQYWLLATICFFLWTYEFLPQAGTPHYGIPMVTGKSSDSSQMQASTITENWIWWQRKPESPKSQEASMRTFHFHHQEKKTTFSGHAPKRSQIGTQMGDQDTKNRKRLYISQNRHRSLSNGNEAFQIENASFSLQSGS